MNIALRVIHVDCIPELSEKLGILATIEITQGSPLALDTGEFEDLEGSNRWRLTSVAHCDPPGAMTMAVAFKKVSGSTDLSVGMELRQVSGSGS